MQKTSSVFDKVMGKRLVQKAAVCVSLESEQQAKIDICV